MRKLFYIAIAALIFSACTKKDNNPRPVSITGTVSINGATYGTVVIGNQTWTSVNYNGPGGVNYNYNFVNNPSYGKLYTIAEAEAITLPKGWRVPAQDDYSVLLIAIGAVNSKTGAINYQNQTFYVPPSVGYKLMADTGWSSNEGTNASRFNALPMGYFDYSTFSEFGTDAVFITTSTLATTGIQGIPSSFGVSNSSAIFDDFIYTPNGRASLRFVKDNF